MISDKLTFLVLGFVIAAGPWVLVLLAMKFFGAPVRKGLPSPREHDLDIYYGDMTPENNVTTSEVLADVQAKKVVDAWSDASWVDTFLKSVGEDYDCGRD